ncbi:hypothetical protein HPB51_017652 [Rhipicephalus microplus]|uniref:Uncharacterized protein n=1 Tax=Rhipicephalus microplus TaxID=6941 RepID=A0A9J6E2J0_RHIMP|nr:hypothetical protein HPB51_017652 [Rhipicephalus microplus]
MATGHPEHCNTTDRTHRHIDNTAKEKRAVREELAEERNWRTALCAQVEELWRAPLYACLEAADQNLAQDSAAAEVNARRVSECATTGDNTECQPKTSLDSGKRDKVLESYQNVGTEGPQRGQAWKVALSKKGKKKKKAQQMQELTTPGGSPAAPPHTQEYLKGSLGVKRKDRHAFIYRDESPARMKHTVLRTVKWNKLVHCRVGDGASIQNIIAQVDSAADICNMPEAVDVLHAGLTNLQKDDVPQEVEGDLKVIHSNPIDHRKQVVV